MRTCTLRSLYRGLSITLLFSVPALSVYLTCYETTKASLGRPDAVWNHLISGCVAEVAAGTLFTPMEVMKNQLQTGSHAMEGFNLAKRIWRTEGLPGFFRGYWMGLAVFVPHTMAYFAMYEECKRQFRLLSSSTTEEEETVGGLPWSAYMACSSVASTVGIVVSTPLDIVKTRWQISASEQGVAFRKGPVAITRQMWKQEGQWRAFTRGLGARIAWGIPTTAISMTVFEALKDWRAAQY